MTKQELINECDMLEGNIARMMVTNDVDELLSMYEWAKKRLDRILTANRNMIRGKRRKHEHEDVS